VSRKISKCLSSRTIDLIKCREATAPLYYAEQPNECIDQYLSKCLDNQGAPKQCLIDAEDACGTTLPPPPSPNECRERIGIECKEADLDPQQCADKVLAECPIDQPPAEGDCKQRILDDCAKAGGEFEECYERAEAVCGSPAPDDGDPTAESCKDSVFQVCRELNLDDEACYALFTEKCTP
jgi:hypothetical protein